MRRRGPAVAAVTLLLLCLAGAGAAAVTIDGIAATVNGEVITVLELEKAGRRVVEKRLATVLPRERDKVKREVLTAVLEQMVSRSLQLQRARQLGLRVGDQEIDDAVARIMASNNLTPEMFDKALAEEGLSREEHRAQVADQIMFSKLMQREIREKITVTPAEVEKYYAEHKEEYFQPEKIRVRHLLVKVAPGSGPEAAQEARKKALEILEEFRGGTDFAALVSRHSPETAAGGEGISGWLRRGEFLAELEDVAFSLPAGEVSEPIRSQAGFHLIQVVERQDASYLSPAAVGDSIEEKLTRGKMEQNYKEWLAALRKNSQVSIQY